VFIEADDRAPQLKRAVGGRIVRLAGAQQLDDVILELDRNAELVRREIADGEIADFFSARRQRPDLAGDFQDLRAGQAAGEGGQTAIVRSQVAGGRWQAFN